MGFCLCKLTPQLGVMTSLFPWLVAYKASYGQGLPLERAGARFESSIFYQFTMAEENKPQKDGCSTMLNYLKAIKAIKRKPSSDLSRDSKRRCFDEVNGNHRSVASKPKWMSVSQKYKAAFQKLVNVLENEPDKIKMINGNAVCFQPEFMIGTGSCLAKVFICLGLDGVERAIKRMPITHQDMLENERDLLLSVNVKNCNHIVDYWYYDDTSSHCYAYLILDLGEMNLKQFIENCEAIDEARAKEMICQILKGLRALHSREPRIVHRDLKPQNVLLNVKGDLLLSDFGIARRFPVQGNSVKYYIYVLMNQCAKKTCLLSFWGMQQAVQRC